MSKITVSNIFAEDLFEWFNSNIELFQLFSCAIGFAPVHCAVLMTGLNKRCILGKIRCNNAVNNEYLRGTETFCFVSSVCND